jgi:hypothetical protein
MSVIQKHRRVKVAAAIAAAFAVWAVALYHVVLYVQGYRFCLTPPYRAVLRNASSAEKYGLRVTMQRVRREGNQLSVAYTLEHVEVPDGEMPLFFLHPWFVPHIQLWDADNKRISGELLGGATGLPQAFLEHKVRLYEGVVQMAVPKEARYISIGDGPNVMTNPVRIPRGR